MWVILQRSCKVVVHEIAHLFGLHRCIYMSCVEKGANSQAEGDRVPHHLCPVCLRKLQSSVGFDLVERHRDLARFYERNSWLAEATWVRARVAKAVNIPVLDLAEWKVSRVVSDRPHQSFNRSSPATA